MGTIRAQRPKETRSSGGRNGRAMAARATAQRAMAHATAKPAEGSSSASSTGGVPAIAPRLLTPGGAAIYLGVSAWTIRELEARGMIRRTHLDLGKGEELRRVLYDVRDLDRYIEACRRSS